MLKAYTRRLELVSLKVIYRNSLVLYLPSVKPVLSNHSKIDKTKILMSNGSLMKVESIADYSAIL